MGLLQLVGLKPTKAQLGAANDPAAHLPTVMARPPYAGDNFPAANDEGSVAVLPNFRAPAAQTPVAFPSFDSTNDNRAATHAQAGPVNSRQTFAPVEGIPQAGSAVPATQFLPVTGEQVHDIVMEPRNAGQISYPDRYRAGGTSVDNTRPSRNSIWYFLRPFDKGIADRFMTGRWTQSSPLASQPLTFRTAVVDSVPYAGGQGAAPGMSSIGIQPNSSRLLPNAWDQDIYNPQQNAAVDNSANHGAVARANGWRALA